MLDDAVVIGVVMALVEIVKAICEQVGTTEETRKRIITPFAVLGLAAMLCVTSAAIFEPGTPWREALKHGLALGATASGVYGLGKAALGKS